MDDREIVALFEARDERALGETKEKYGRYIRSVALRILGSKSDAEECENDVYLRAWNSIPPQKPEPLKRYLAVLCRRAAFDLYEKRSAGKRGGGQAPGVYEELEEVLSSAEESDPADQILLRDAMRRFLASLDASGRSLFLQRYFYLFSVKEIAKKRGMKESAVKTALMRLRGRLKDFLVKEGFDL